MSNNIRIVNVWNLTREAFIIEAIAQNKEDCEMFNRILQNKWPEKQFIVNWVIE